MKRDEHGRTEGLGKGCDACTAHGAQGELHIVGPWGPLLVHVLHSCHLGQGLLVTPSARLMLTISLTAP